ncbi:unnamed protein product [Cylicocyclus nassatus]|uniref:Uncharacterized protein n=1 Tax=Cylicocyclus nassatus TaxID=53992 RepID=A0AA36DLY2_CYLNA|nr:unnamed protein product [Cylicocyclus nassatus]
MFLTLAATLVLLSSFMETVSAPTYKSATDAFKDLTEFSDAEFEEYKKAVLERGKTAEALKMNKAIANKIKTMNMKLTKLMKPAQGFAINIIYYALTEMKKNGSHAQKLQKDFEKLRKDKKACENLLSSYPKLKLGKC